MQNRAPYFMTKYPDFQSAVSLQFIYFLVLGQTNDVPKVDAFLLDFDNAKSHALDVDNKIIGAASGISSLLPNVVSLVARQAIGATELTVASGTDGKWNTTDIMMFMKNVGTDRCIPSSKLLRSH